MKTRVRIFAKRYTDCKVAILCEQEQIPGIMKSLNFKFGKDWVFVDELRVMEGISFNDNFEYKGYHPSIQRYSEAIITV